MRKYLSFAQAVLLTTGLWATSSQAMNKAFTGFQAKGSLGYAAGSAKFKGTQTDAGNQNAQIFKIGSYSLSGINASLGLGYNQALSNTLIAGAELYGFYNPLKSKALIAHPSAGAGAPDHTSATLKRSFGYGVKLTGGYTVSDSALMYAGVAVERSKFNIKMDSTGFDVAKKSKNLWGFGPIVGAKMALTDSMALNLEGTYILYKKWTQNFSGNQQTLPLKINPQILSVKAGLSVAF